MAGDSADAAGTNGAGDPTWAREALARINAATGRSYQMGEHRPPPHPMRPSAGVWVVTDGDHRACLKRLPGDTDLVGQRAASITCERLHAAGSPVPRYHLIDAVAGDGLALMDFMPGHPVLLGGLSASQARHLLELIELQAGAAVLPPAPPDTTTDSILTGVAHSRLRAPSPEATALLARIEAMARELHEVRTPSGDIVHTDMNPSNFIVDRDGGDHITGIVDWENTTSGDRAADVHTSLFYSGPGEVGDVLWEGLVALCTHETLRLRTLGLASWTLSRGRIDRASWFLSRIAD